MPVNSSMKAKITLVVSSYANQFKKNHTIYSQSGLTNTNLNKEGQALKAASLALKRPLKKEITDHKASSFQGKYGRTFIHSERMGVLQGQKYTCLDLMFVY